MIIFFIFVPKTRLRSRFLIFCFQEFKNDQHIDKIIDDHHNEIGVECEAEKKPVLPHVILLHRLERCNKTLEVTTHLKYVLVITKGVYVNFDNISEAVCAACKIVRFFFDYLINLLEKTFLICGKLVNICWNYPPIFLNIQLLLNFWICMMKK